MEKLLHKDPELNSFLNAALNQYGEDGLVAARETVKQFENHKHNECDAGFIKEALMLTFWDAMDYYRRHPEKADRSLRSNHRNNISRDIHGREE